MAKHDLGSFVGAHLRTDRHDLGWLQDRPAMNDHAGGLAFEMVDHLSHGFKPDSGRCGNPRLTLHYR